MNSDKSLPTKNSFSQALLLFKRDMKIYLHEITETETELEFTQEETWVREAVESVDEEGTSSDLSRASPLKTRPIQASFSLRKVDDVIVTSGSLNTYVRLLCSRCANVFQFETHPRFSALFCTDPVMAGVGHLESKGKPAGQNKGYARHAHDSSLDNSEDGNNQDLDITYLSEDSIDLADLLAEQLRLQIPFRPLCQENCKGICTHCGADQNLGKCACSKLINPSPFAALKNLKLS